jgi:transmembrane sensor
VNYDEIENLLLKYRQGKCTPAEKDRIHQWYEQVQGDVPQTEISDTEKSLLKARMWTAIQHDRRTPERRTTWSPRLSGTTVRMFSSIAAALVVSLSLFYFYSGKSSPGKSVSGALLPEASHEGLVSTNNNTAQPMRIKLTDSSEVTLAPGAGLTYPRQFSSGKREVELRGDAFFNITRDSHRPFFVYSGKLVTRVLGTSFWVKEGGEEHQMQVEVVCGKVSVFENESIGTIKPSQSKHQFNKGVILTPNQRVTYFEESGHLMTSLVDKPVLLTAHAELPAAIYKNIALPEVFQRLEDAYGVDIVVSGEAVNECTFTGDLTNMSLFDQLDLICQSNDGFYQVQGTRILVSAAGCK